jgi:primosomal protein N' (replication factor Y)
VPFYFYYRLKSFLKDQKEEGALQGSYSFYEDYKNNKNYTLTGEQECVYNYLAQFISNTDINTRQFVPTLLHGVTSSGKTEIYKKLIELSIKQNKSVIVLHPEVCLSLQFTNLFREQLSCVETYGFHSASSIKEKRELWGKLCDSKALVICGVHLPVLLPISNLGLIIVDEEHERGFCEKKNPKLNSKELALWRASVYGIPILLGSATPSLLSLHNVNKGAWKMFSLTKRFEGDFPEVKKVVFTKESIKKRKNFWISQELEGSIAHCLEKKEQAIIFINRRGYSFFVQCKGCGYVFQCPACSVSLVLHCDKRGKREGNSAGLRPLLDISGVHKNKNLNNTGEIKETLRCHYCDFCRALPKVCPECKSSRDSFLKKGLGTQQVVQILQGLFPCARIERADLDTTRKKKFWGDTVIQFTQGNIDILVGTQSITKGYHFPNVSLIGVLWGDLNLHFPLYYAAEMTLQQLIQVAGRSGRVHKGASVIVQIMRDHYIFDYVTETKYLDFCAREFLARQEVLYPPFCRLISLEIKHKESGQVEQDAQACVNLLSTLCAKIKKDKNNNCEIKILGPAVPLVYKVQNIEMRQIFLKAKSFSVLHTVLNEFIKHNKEFKSEINIIVSA